MTPQPHALPPGWTETRLSEVGFTYGGLTGKSAQDFGTGEGRYVPFTNVIQNIRLNPSNLERVRIQPGEVQNTVAAGDLLLNASSETPDEVGMACYVDGDRDLSDIYLNSFCFGFRITAPQRITPVFLAYQLRGPPGRRLMAPLAQGFTRYNLSKQRFLALEVPTPPLDEQNAIATALRDVDSFLISLDALVAKKRDLRTATQQALMSAGDRRQNALVANTGPADWITVKLEQLADLSRDPISPMSDPDRRFAHFSIPAFDAGRQPVVERGAEIGSQKFRVRPGAVLLSRLNARIPRVWVPKSVPEWSVASTEFVILLPKQSMDRQFLGYLLSSDAFRRQVVSQSKGTTGSHQRIHQEDVLSVEVSVPKDMKQQKAIAEVLSDMDAEIDAFVARREKTELLKQGMMQELLTGRTRLVA